MSQQEMAAETDEDIVPVSHPKDRYNLVYLSFFVIGLGNLIPWNFFTTAKWYFQHQLRNTSLPNDTDPLDPTFFTSNQVLFTNYVAVCSMFPFAAANVCNLFLQRYISAFSRFRLGSFFILSVLVLTILLGSVKLAATVFLGITLFSVIIMNVGTALTQGSLLGVLSGLPSRNVKGLLEGQAFAGILAAVANIVVISVSPNPVSCGMGFFSIAIAFIWVSIFQFYLLPRNAYFRHYWKPKELQSWSKRTIRQRTAHLGDISEVSIDSSGSNEQQPLLEVVQPRHSLLSSMREIFFPGCCIYVLFVVTLSLYPSVLALIQPRNFSTTDVWSSTFFVPVTIFLSFNICDYLGRGLCGFVKWPRADQPKLLGLFCILRVVFIPLIMLCNQQPRHLLPVVFTHDAWPIILVIIVALTNGYLLTLSIMYAPNYASAGNEESAGIAVGIYIALGLSSGVAVSFALVALL